MALPISGIQLRAANADIFIRQMAAAESAVERFRKSASRPTPFTQPDTRNAVAAFNDLVAKSQAAGQKAGAGMATGFEAGLSPIQTIVQGALLKTGALAVDAAIGLFTKAGQAASSAFNDALEFDLAVDSIAALTPAGEAAGAGIAAAIGGIATDANLVGSVDSATAAFYALSQGGIAVEDSIAGTLRSTILLQNSVGSLPGDLYETRDAAEVVAQGVQIFGLQAEETGGFVDALAAIAVNGRANLSDLNYVLANSASSVQSLGISYNDLAAATIASSASFSSSRTQLTAFDSFLSGLSAPTDKMKEALGLLGISAYDAKGDFVGLISLQGQLKAAFESGQYTTQAFQQLLTEGFGSVGRDFAVAIAKGEDFTTVLQGIEATSSEAIAAIKVDNAATALTNLGDIAQDLGRRLLQPFTEALTPAIQSLSSLLSSLAGYFDMVGQRIAASLSPILTYVTAQINGLSGAISALTGISVPTLGAGAAPGAAPAYGPQPAPSSTFASGSAGTDARQQERIGVAQLDSAEAATGAAKSMSSALSQLDDILSSSVSALDVNLANEGLYEDKPDEKLRQLRAYVKNGSEQYAGVADDYRVALERIGVKPAEDAETFLMQVEELQASKAIFADPRNIELLIDEEAVKREVEMKELAQKGAQNIALAFGDYVAGLVEATSSGISGGAAPAAVTPPTATPADPTAFYDPYELYVKPVQDAQVEQAKQAATNQEGLLGGLFSQFDVLNEKFGAVTLLFEGFNTILGGLTENIQGKDFQAAGLAVGGTLETVLGALTQITELADIGTTTANLSSFTQTILDSAANFADGVDGEAVAESAGTLLTTVVGKLVEAVDSADLTGIATSFTGMLTNVGSLLVEAIHGFDFAGVGLSIGTLISRVANQLIGALQDPSVAQNLGDAAGNFATGAIGALKGAFELLGGALATADENTDAGEITKGISGLITTVVSRFTSAVSEVKLDDLGTEVTGMIGHIANLFLEAVQGVQFDAIGTAIGEMVGTIVNKFTELISNPQVGIDIGGAAGDFVSGIITAVQGAFSLLSSALTGADDTIDITALTGAIDGVVQGFVQGFIASITRNFTNPDTGAVEIALPTVNVLPLETIDLSTLVSYINEPAKEEIDRSTLVSYINELPAEFQVEKDKLVSYINELPASEEIDKAKLVSYINELPGATEVDKAKLVGYINELPEPTEVDQSKLVQVTGTLPETIELDLSSLVTFTGADSESTDVSSGFAPLTEAINLLAPALTGVSLAVGLADGGLRKLAEPGGGFDQLTGLVTGTVDTISASIEGVDVDAVGGALNSAIGSITGLFVTLSEIPDLAPITASIGGFVTALLDLSSGLVGNIDGEQAGADISTVASNLISRLAEGITAVPLEEIGVAAANLVGALAGTFRDALTVDNLAGVGESIGQLVTGIIEQLTATLGNPDFGATLGQAFGDFVAGIVQGAAGLIQGIGTGIDGEAVSGIGDALYTFVTSFVEGIATSLATVEWGTVGQAIYDGIYGAITTLFSGAESLADNIFGLAFSGGQALAEASGLQGALTPEGIADAGQGAINFFAPIAKKLSGDMATAFGEGKVYTADVSDSLIAAGAGLANDVASYFAEDAIYPDVISTGLANAATGITTAFGGILDAVTGFWDSLLGALPDWAKGLLGIGGTEAAKVETPEEKKVAQDVADLATKGDVVNLANTIGNSGQIAPTMDVGSTLAEIQQTQANIEAGAYRQQPSFDPSAYGGASAFDGSTIPVTIENPEAIAQPTSNADGSLTAAGQEQAVANLGALFGGLSANLSEAIAPAIAQAGGQLAGAVGSLQGQAQIGPPTAGYNPLSSAITPTTVVIPPVELSENAATLINNYNTAQAQANAQGQDTAAQLPTAEAITGLTAAASLLQVAAANQLPAVSLASSSLVGVTAGEDAAGLGGEYGPPVVQAIADNTAAVNSLVTTQVSQPAIGPALGDVEPLEYGADTVKLLEEQTEAILRNTAVQETQTGDEAGAAANPKSAQELKTLETAIPTAGQKFTVSLTGTATTSGVASEQIDKLGGSAEEAVTPIDDMTTASDGVAGSLNILLGKSDDTAASLSDLNDAFAADGLTGGITDLTDALDQAVDDINAALKKLDGDSGGSDTPPADSNPNQPEQFAKGGSAQGIALVGEEGPELAIDSRTGAVGIVGQQGPEIKRFVQQTEIYTADETEAILRRSGKPTAIGSFADGTTNAAGKALVGEDGPEIVWNREQQTAWLVGQQGPQVVEIPAGSAVYTSDETNAILRRSGSATPVGSFANGGTTAGKALVGEDGPELAYNPITQAAFVVGQRGPEIREFASDTQIYTSDETNAILRRSGEPTNDSAIGSFAGGTGGAAVNGLVGEPSHSEFRYIPQGASSSVGMAPIQGMVGEPIQMRADGGTTAGKALVGEEGPELAYNPVLQSAYLIGQRGPEIRDFDAGTFIYPAEETNAILARSGGSSDKVFGSFAGGGVFTGDLGDFTPTDTLPTFPVPSFPSSEDDSQEEESVATEQTSLLDNPFVRSILGKQLGGQQQAGGSPFKSVASQFNSGDGFDVNELVNAFNRPLFGKMTPASVTVNITVNNNSTVDNSVRTYTLGGVSTQQRTESIIDSFRLLQSQFG